MIKKILIVDDSLISVKIMKSCIPKDKDYELFDAPDGQSGLEKYKEIKPDLTFMDLTMPVMDGFQALEEILKFDQKAIVIICTADVQIKAIAKAHDLGAFSVVKKPPAKESIAAAIKEADNALAERG
ncbi:MAG: response regulator [Smithella sp.]|jgi:two-component system chemotaxis response regulator CheY